MDEFELFFEPLGGIDGYCAVALECVQKFEQGFFGSMIEDRVYVVKDVAPTEVRPREKLEAAHTLSLERNDGNFS